MNYISILNILSMKKKKRNPKFLGCGIYVHSQTFNDIVKGDTFWDADFGMMIWNGKSWKSKKL
jgi:hypothetical protein